ncbi:MAG: hypothetical protein CMJ46_10100 [Planctomyces sp.]|nr:hypothetical protein [Planctomyces sp.]
MSTPEINGLLQRIVELETLFTHLQHDVQQLNDVIIEQRQELEKLHEVNDRLQQHIEDLENPEERNPSDERPPHY